MYIFLYNMYYQNKDKFIEKALFFLLCHNIGQQGKKQYFH